MISTKLSKTRFSKHPANIFCLLHYIAARKLRIECVSSDAKLCECCLVQYHLLADYVVPRVDETLLRCLSVIKHDVLVSSRRMSVRGATGQFTESHLP